MDNLKVCIIQVQLHWENPVANLLMFSEKINSISEKIDLIVLPEMFTTGFTMNAIALSEEETGESVQWMISQARQYDVAITGSLIIKENKNFYNRLYFVFPDGSFQTYDKRHTFTLAGENRTYTAGDQQVIVEYKGWKICPLICYDLRFPVWARNTQSYDLLIYVANWPEKRISAWDALLKARAIENMSFCVGVNRVGQDGNGHEYVGHSAIYDVLGAQISTRDFEKEFVEIITLDKSHLISNRDHLQFLNDKDSFNLT
jgi:omega-amidase